MRKLIIVGAGLGKESITLQGINALKKADTVLYDRLINKEILNYTNCLKIDVGKIPYKSCTRQSDINELIKKELKNDKTVVRLKGGDSTVFARSIEEMKVAEKLNAHIEIIPGVTSAATFSAKLKLSLTDREKSSGVIFITGHSKTANIETTYNWAAIAKLNLTIVIYMGIKNMPLISNLLINNGMNENTPLIFGEKLETKDERIIKTTLKNAAQTINEENIKHPATTVIGNIFDNFK